MIDHLKITLKGGILTNEQVFMTGNIKPRPLHVVEKGFFRKNDMSWSSEQCHALIKYRPATDSIIFCKVYGQKGKEDTKGELVDFVKPHFPKDAVQRLLEYARRRPEEGYAHKKRHRGKHRKLKGHRKDLCEKCCSH